MISAHFDIHVSPNRIRVTNSRSGRSVDHAAETPFSAGSTLVADPDALTASFNAALKSAAGRQRFVLWPKATIRSDAGQLDAAERSMLLRAAKEAGVVSISFDP